MRKNVWSKDFTLITIGTVISIIGGTVIRLPLSLLVFDETNSTFLAALLFIIGLVPSVIIPIIIAPIIDRNPKKPIIVGFDYLLGIFYLIIAFIVFRIGFNYNVYLLISFLLGIIGSVYGIAYQAWFPDLIPIGFEQQGFAVSSSIYPSVNIIMAPVAAFLYKSVEIYWIFVLVGVLLLISATFEMFIEERIKSKKSQSSGLKGYFKEMMSGIEFLKKEKGITYIYTYISVVNGVGMGNSLMVQAFFQTSSFLSVTMLGIIKSAETLGRVVGGMFQYKIKVDPKKRYGVTKVVYITYEALDIILLFLPYPLMLINRFVAGFGGMVSATLRETSVQSYLPREMRAKINAVFGAAINLFMIVIQLVTGALGDILGYRTVVVIMSLFAFLCIYLFIIKPKEQNEKVYEAVRVEE